MRKIYIIGIGMGNPDCITIKGKTLIESSEALIGAKRMVDSFVKESQQAIYAIAPLEILEWIETHGEIESIAVLMSGDLGFFSGAKKLRMLIEGKYGRIQGDGLLHFEYVPGISSLSYFSAAIGISWENAKLISLHGREDSAAGVVLNNEKTFFLTDGGNNTVRKICKDLTEMGLGHVKIFVGERLSYEDEKITVGTAQEISKENFETLSVMMAINGQRLETKKDTLGISDEEFIRGSVPMTKEEVRTLAVSKLNLRRDDIVYDIGAGTGSVSVEMALACRVGRIYAIETNEEAIALIHKNKEAFQVSNLQVIQGMAPKIMETLPIPSRAFIGGSKGNLDEIIGFLLARNPEIRIVMNVTALESLGEAVNSIRKYNFKDVDITQVSISKAKSAGKYHLMMGQNPIYMIAVQGI